MDSAMFVGIDSLSKLPAKEQLVALRDIRNQLIGCQDTKQAYFDKGLIEVVVPLLTAGCDTDVCSEILIILNCYTFDCPKALECLGHFLE